MSISLSADPFALKGQAVVITGGTSGIGHAVALAFAEQGAQVTVTGATKAEADACRQSHPHLNPLALDSRDRPAVVRFVSGLNHLTHLINAVYRF